MTRLMGSGGAQPVKVSIACVLRLSSWVATCLMGTGDNQRVLGRADERRYRRSAS